MYHNILVPVVFDNEHDTAGALKLAQALCAETGKITLLHVIETVPTYVATFVPPEFLENTREAATGSLAELTARVPGATGEVIHGHASRSILDWGREHTTDLIILASHRPGMQDLLLGSTATQVVRHAHCAVHVIR